MSGQVRICELSWRECQEDTSCTAEPSLVMRVEAILNIA
jgi:hypothetical protein